MLIWVGIAAIAFVGAILLAVGLRGRQVDDHPICRRCGFDLIGVWLRFQKCPECGTDIVGNRAIRIGTRRRRMGVFCTSLVMLLLCLIGGSVIGWSRAKSFNWNTIKPVWMLSREAESASNLTAAAALSELTRRLTGEALEQEVVDDLVERGLLVQRDQNVRWISEWGDLIDAADARGKVSDEQYASYVRHALVNGVNMTMSVREKIVERDGPEVLPIQFSIGNARLGSNTHLWIHAKLESALAGDIKVAVYGGGSVLSVRSTSTSSARAERSVDLPPGPSELRAMWRLTAVESPGGATIAEWTTEFVTSINVVPSEESGIVLAVGGTNTDQIKASINVKRLVVIQGAGNLALSQVRSCSPTPR